MNNKIGGFFEKDADSAFIKETKQNNDLEKKIEYVISGRASISLILEDYKSEFGSYPNSVYLPNYICLTMIQPFLDCSVGINFYKVYIDEKQCFKIDLSSIDNCFIPDLFLFMRYFGFELSNENDLSIYLEKLKKKGTTIVEDITHSYFRGDVLKFNSDYYVSSIRKWCAISSGGVAIKKKDVFRVGPFINSDKYVEDQLFYMKLKAEGMNSYNGKSLYERNMEYNQVFNNLDWKYKIDSQSKSYWDNLDKDKIVGKRKENGLYIYENIIQSSKTKMIGNFTEKTVPLFIPIIFEGDIIRLKKKLIDEDIFLPNHWKIEYPKTSDIWKKEISVICDQRYDLNDMKKTVTIINSNSGVKLNDL